MSRSSSDQRIALLLIAYRSLLIACRKNAPGLGPGAKPLHCSFYAVETHLLMAAIVFVAIDLARRPILLAVHLGALLRR